MSMRPGTWGGDEKTCGAHDESLSCQPLDVGRRATLTPMIACGGGNPTPPTVVPPPSSPPAAQPWTLAGRILATASGAPIASARVESSLGPFTSDGGGLFTLTAPSAPASSLQVTVTADGHRRRETTISLPRTNDLVLDLMSTAPPFDEVFYNQLARDALDEPARNHQLWRWRVAPKYYLQTSDENGQPVPPEVLRVVRQAISDGTHYFTGGRFAATIEEGSAARPEFSGWVNVLPVRNIPAGDLCGYATSIGGNPSTI